MTSKWDRPGVASYIEGYWDSPDEVALREQVAAWIRPQVVFSSLLDVGCGSGRMAPLLPQCMYTGMDGSREMLTLAKKRSPQSMFVQADILVGALPYGDRACNSALCMHVMRHLPGYQILLRELKRIARKCVFIVDVFHAEGAHRFGTSDVADQIFWENSWSLPLFLADVSLVFPGWRTSVVNCAGAVGVGIEAP